LGRQAARLQRFEDLIDLGRRQIFFEHHVGIGADGFGELLLSVVLLVEARDEHDAESRCSGRRRAECTAPPHIGDRLDAASFGFCESWRKVVAVDRSSASFVAAASLGAASGIWRRRKKANRDEDKLSEARRRRSTENLLSTSARRCYGVPPRFA
jgi:hypothetical protein